MQADMHSGAAIPSLRRFNEALLALTEDNWRERLTPVLAELCFNLESFNPAFAAVLLSVQSTIGNSSYQRRDAALKQLIVPLAGEYGMHNGEHQGMHRLSSRRVPLPCEAGMPCITPRDILYFLLMEFPWNLRDGTLMYGLLRMAPSTWVYQLFLPHGNERQRMLNAFWGCSTGQLNRSVGCCSGKTHRELFDDWVKSMVGESASDLIAKGRDPIHARRMFDKMMMDIPNGGGLPGCPLTQATYALGYNLAIEYLAHYEQRRMLESFPILDGRLMKKLGCTVDWLFLEVRC